MNNFTFYNLVKILFGKGTISKTGTEIPQGAKILLTYGGGSIFKNGVYDQVKESVKDFEVLEFGGIEPNPHYETLMKAVEIAKNEKIDFLLSVGGGSVLDGTKFIAAAVYHQGNDPWDILANRAPVEKALPIGAVLTLPATGSEMNGGAVITRVEIQEKLVFGSDLVMPKFSVLDPEVIFSLPDRQVANGIVDAFVHVTEQYLTYPVNSPIQDRFAESIMQTLIEEGPKVLANRTDYDSAANFMWSATMALNGLIGVGVPQDWATHMIGHELTAFHGIDHGRTLCIVLPGIMKVFADQKKEKIIQLGERVFKVQGRTDEQKIENTISAVVYFFESVGVPTRLPEYGVPAETIDRICARFEKRGYKIGEKANIGPKEIRMILEDRL
ncbi:MAG: aldehyde reductase [Bacteroidetes bacterium GWF2_42_66]|nr:MAG: aldehyde reductase [Bacteroidetes bacterium GWA2_42_15]OFY01127.1 MAG: aldehyde reductase [Bacteroidetes bacterium GWE2_42_39]OFY41970.1 MAG: aldehyde reductase [Bacteroidetes bacterium GWF2_42_66]HBL77833.1 NADH-dependent alcohol dehydrogenase [Prolixibacteraceae bacterium]HCR90917.1 NADH-dependent alcohol dehydrogenase [Prolixibacteraceae bacterium]